MSDPFYTKSIARWAADHVSADQLAISRKGNTTLVVMRFGDDYCAFEMEMPQYQTPHQDMVRLATATRDEFFLFGMHRFPSGEAEMMFGSSSDE